MTANTQDLKQRGTDKNTPPNSSDPKRSKKVAVLAYMFLPGIIPQIKELSSNGFGYLAMLIASIYQAVRILPAGHPYTKYENIGKFGIRHVIAAAANNIKLEKKNIDQIIIFIAIMMGLLLLVLQFVGFIILLFSGEAWAADAVTGGLFETQYPNTDIAFHMMREVFGIPDLFGKIPNGPTAFHIALHTLFRFYNSAILIVAILVFIYYVIVVVAETAQTGTPFGQRFSHVYAPIRLVMAIALLIPLNHGLSGSQYVTLYAAKMGSGFATTGWIRFNESLTGSNPLGAENLTLIAETKQPDFRGLTAFMATAVTCREAYALLNPTIDPIKAEVVYHEGKTVKIISLPTDIESLYTTLIASKNKEDLIIRFGAMTTDLPPTYAAYCGSVTIPISVSMEASTNGDGNPGNIQKAYLATVKSLWDNEELKRLGKNFTLAVQINPTEKCKSSQIAQDAAAQQALDAAALGAPSGVASYIAQNSKCNPDLAEQEPILSNIRTAITTAINEHYQNARDHANFEMREDTKKRGWGGAGIWYNRIAQINGAYVTATMSIPTGKDRPIIMERVLSYKKGTDGVSSTCKAFEPNLADNKKIDLNQTYLKYAKIFDSSYRYWNCEQTNTSNFFLDALSAVFGLNGLMSIRDQVDTGKTDSNGKKIMASVHPLAKLSALGKGLIESAVRNMGFAMGVSAMSGMFSSLQNMGPALSAASSFFVSIATIGLSMGFITYYILPFLPFIFFFFAVGGWVKSIFEAMVGAPLWALAHLRIDGDGLPGKMAINGYFLIFEIFIRPILTIFGLLGGMAIFTALATMLNEVFDLVVLNTSDVDLNTPDSTLFSRHPIDVFFFTCVYTIILYMMAVSSFKMINLVPNNILRWLGTSVTGFNDQAGDPTANLTQYASIGGQQIGGKLAGGMTQLSQGAGSVFGMAFNKPPGGGGN